MEFTQTVGKHWMVRLSGLGLLLALPLLLSKCSKEVYEHSLNSPASEKAAYYISPKTSHLSYGSLYIFKPDSTGEYIEWYKDMLVSSVQTRWRKKHDTIYVKNLYIPAVNVKFVMGEENTLKWVLNQKKLPIFYHYDSLPESLEEMRQEYKRW